VPEKGVRSVLNPQNFAQNLGLKVKQIQREMHMLNLNQLKFQYITDKMGKKTAVILPIQEFQELLEDIEDLAAVAERREEPRISHDELLAELRRDGLL
jgi:hypothetical protein